MAALWHKLWPQDQDKGPTFQVACTCGRTLTGRRQIAYQVLPCPGCGEKVFVLPLSPLPSVQRQQPSTGVTDKRLRPRDWLLILGAVVLAFGGLIGLYFLLLARPSPPAGNGVTLADRLERAQKLLAEGSFRLALEELRDSAGQSLDPGPLAAEQAKAWRQLEREAAVLADLVAEPLEDILRNAAGARPEEWEREFPARYQGKAVLFDATVRRTAKGWRLDYPLLGDFGPARFALDDFQLFLDWRQEGPERLIFGARLASVRLEAPGPILLIRLQPASGVLLTNPQAAAWCCPAFAQEDARTLLQKQKLLVVQQGVGLSGAPAEQKPR